METTTTSTHEVSTSTHGISEIDTLTETINRIAIHAVESKEEEESKKKIEPVEEQADSGDDGDDYNHAGTEEKDENVFEHYEVLYQQSVRTISKDCSKSLFPDVWQHTPSLRRNITLKERRYKKLMYLSFEIKDFSIRKSRDQLNM